MKKYMVIFGLLVVSFGVGEIFSSKNEVVVQSNSYLEESVVAEEGSFFLDGSYLRGVGMETSRGGFSFLNDSVKKSEFVNCLNQDYVGTGCVLRVTDLSDQVVDYSIIVSGDVNGDGKVTLTDVVKLYAHSVDSSKKLEGAYAEAANVNYDSKVSIMDATSLAFYQMESISVPASNQDLSKEIVTVENQEMELTKGESQEIVYHIWQSDVTVVEWKSSDTSVATVDQNGRVIAVGGGETEITLTVSTGDEATVSVFVAVEATGVQLSKSSLTLDVNDTYTLSATVLPEEAENKEVTWKSSDTSIATVDSNGKIVAKGKGKTKITVQTLDGAKSASCTVKVVVPVKKVTLNKSSLSLAVGGKSTLKAMVAPSDSSNQGVSWKSSNTTVVTVSSKGVVTAVGVGTAKITAKSKTTRSTTDIYDTCTVTVKNGYTVLINPSHQATNVTTSSSSKYNTEKKSMYVLADLLKKSLEKKGYVVYLSPRSGSISSGDGCWTDSSNNFGTCGPKQINWLKSKKNTSKTIYLALHSNAVGTSGTSNVVGPFVFYASGHSGGLNLAKKLCSSLDGVYRKYGLAPTGNANSCYKTWTTVSEPRKYYEAGGKGEAVLIEIGFHDNPTNQKFIENYRQKLVDGVILGLNNYIKS